MVLQLEIHKHSAWLHTVFQSTCFISHFLLLFALIACYQVAKTTPVDCGDKNTSTMDSSCYLAAICRPPMDAQCPLLSEYVYIYIYIYIYIYSQEAAYTMLSPIDACAAAKMVKCTSVFVPTLQDTLFLVLGWRFHVYANSVAPDDIAKLQKLLWLFSLTDFSDSSH